ncbi:MAG: membrane protein insertion efficiency factor YidD [Planctomycetales bacterium]|nr:membrane protein insertion efficiency factor YidD [Planctomycetales bacterium]NIM09913.1 membrane protein insertion efficiency factor YidD [Planctomycetales bacterium]NIN09352.1 membrane protein insertion efficiency factor YidD [Planctomycetales bacterium]NIN78462.1 membrane protein insertion efficiency factor YidD [Planctomycetales bacterium]NIO35652.1 membrane protein insertion efficiency factor YidD [Planctomycetales bacterium]
MQDPEPKHDLARILWRAITGIGRLPALALLLWVRCYQWTISPLLGPRCRFHPSCSEYFLISVRKHGALRGGLRGVARICRCHPFHPGGYDPP